MYTVTTAARSSNVSFASAPRNASAAPWKLVCTLGGKRISAWAASMAWTASPREAPGARLKERVAAGNWLRWLTDRGAYRAATWAPAPRGAWGPLAAGGAGPARAPGA